jgi:hypothetical protein
MVRAQWRSQFQVLTSFLQDWLGAKWAVHQFIDGLPDNINLGLYVFDQSGSREVLPLGPDNKAEFLSQIDAVVANNGTPLGESIEAAVKALKVQQAKQKPYGEFRLLVVTDGHASDYIGRGVKQAKRVTFLSIPSVLVLAKS